MKQPAGYEKIAAQRWPILAEIKELTAKIEALKESLKPIDEQMVEQLTIHYRGANYANPEQAAQWELKKLHAKFDPK